MDNKIIIYTVDISQIGGIERSISNLLNLLCDENYKVEIVSLFKSKKAISLDIKRAKVTFLSKESSDFINWNLMKSLFVYAKVLPNLLFNIYSNRKYLIISAYPSISLVLCLPLVNKIKSFAWEHSQLDAHSPLLNILRRRLYCKLTGILTVVNSQVSYFKKLNNNVFYFPNPVIIPNFENTNRNMKQDNVIHVIFVGRLSTEKAPDRFIHTIRYLLDNDISVKASIYGDGPLYLECIKLSEYLGVQNMVEFTKNQTDLQKIYSGADFLLLTSINESFGMVLLEAMAYGVIPIATIDGEGPRKIIHDMTNGILFDFNNLESLVIKLQSCDQKSMRYEMKKSLESYSGVSAMKVISEICRLD